MVNFISRDAPSTKKTSLMKRNKRFLGTVVSIGIGSAALTLSSINSIQIMNLKQEVLGMAESLKALQRSEYAQRSQILQLTEGQLKLAVELNHTQQAVDRTMRLVNDHVELLRDHDEAIRKLGEYSIFLNRKLDRFLHAVEGHFLHTSIEDILRGKLNLHFIHHHDLPQVIEHVIRTTNISLQESDSSISMVDLVTRLLVQQEISFVPTANLKASSNGVVVGTMVFTSYFAATSYDEKPFLVYEPIPIPFNYGNKRVRLAQMPAFIGIRPESREFVRWSQEESLSCYFELMTSCRITPPVQKHMEDICIYQILADTPLTSCRIEPYPDPVFIRRVGRYWAISTNSTTKCHSVQVPDSNQFKVIDNHAIILPPTALITTVNSNPLSCHIFHLAGTPTQVGTKLVIYQNTTVANIDEEVLDIHSLVHNNTKREKLIYVPSDIQTIIDFINNTTKPPQGLVLGYFKTHSSISLILILIAILFLLFGLHALYFRFMQWRQRKVSINAPSWKTLERSQNPALNINETLVSSTQA